MTRRRLRTISTMTTALMCALTGCETGETTEPAAAREAQMPTAAAVEARRVFGAHDDAPAPSHAAQQLMAGLAGPLPGSGELPGEGDRGRIPVKGHNGLMGVPYEVRDGQVWVARDHGLGTVGMVFGATAREDGRVGDAGEFMHDLPAQIPYALPTYDVGKRWTDGVVPYEISLDNAGLCDASQELYDATFVQLNVDTIEASLAYLERATPLRFEPATSGERIIFRPWRNSFAQSIGLDAACVQNLDVGKLAVAQQVISLPGKPGGASVVDIFGPSDPDDTIEEGDAQNFPVNLVMHELFHAIGFFHEHQRADRDDHVLFFEECLEDAGLTTEFAVIDGVGDGYLPDVMGPYDIDSIMHYEGATFCIDEDGQEGCDCKPLRLNDGSDDGETLVRDASDCDGFLDAENEPPAEDGLVTPGEEMGDAGEPFCLTEYDLQAVHRIYGNFLKPFAAKRERDEQFGHALAVGDFNGDGYDDFAAGAPFDFGEANGGVRDGRVHTFMGVHGDDNDPPSWSPSREPGAVPWQHVGSVVDAASPRQTQLGWSLAAADFDNDGFADLAVGAPRDAGGAVHLYRGSRVGLTPWTVIPAAGIADGFGPQFGFALDTGDLDGDGTPELVVGAPQARNQSLLIEDGQGVPGKSTSPFIGGCGAAFVMAYDGEDTFTVKWVATPPAEDCVRGAEFGHAVAVGEFGAFASSSEDRAELAVGAPGLEKDAGKAYVWAVTQDATTDGAPDVFQAVQAVTQATTVAGSGCGAQSGVSGLPEPGDRFGASLALGGGDLFVGAPGEDNDAGSVDVFRGGDPTCTVHRPSIVQPNDPSQGEAFGHALRYTELFGGAPSPFVIARGRLLVGSPGERLTPAGCGNKASGVYGRVDMFRQAFSENASVNDWVAIETIPSPAVAEISARCAALGGALPGGAPSLRNGGYRFGHSIDVGWVDRAAPELVIGDPGRERLKGAFVDPNGPIQAFRPVTDEGAVELLKSLTFTSSVGSGGLLSVPWRTLYETDEAPEYLNPTP